jgi:hypothetical protein
MPSLLTTTTLLIILTYIIQSTTSLKKNPNNIGVKLIQKTTTTAKKNNHRRQLLEYKKNLVLHSNETLPASPTWKTINTIIKNGDESNDEYYFTTTIKTIQTQSKSCYVEILFIQLQFDHDIQIITSDEKKKITWPFVGPIYRSFSVMKMIFNSGGFHLQYRESCDPKPPKPILVTSSDGKWTNIKSGKKGLPIMYQQFYTLRTSNPLSCVVEIEFSTLKYDSAGDIIHVFTDGMLRLHREYEQDDDYNEPSAVIIPKLNNKIRSKINHDLIILLQTDSGGSSFDDDDSNLFKKQTYFEARYRQKCIEKSNISGDNNNKNDLDVSSTNQQQQRRRLSTLSMEESNDDVAIVVGNEWKSFSTGWIGKNNHRRFKFIANNTGCVLGLSIQQNVLDPDYVFVQGLSKTQISPQSMLSDTTTTITTTTIINRHHSRRVMISSVNAGIKTELFVGPLYTTLPEFPYLIIDIDTPKIDFNKGILKGRVKQMCNGDIMDGEGDINLVAEKEEWKQISFRKNRGGCVRCDWVWNIMIPPSTSSSSSSTFNHISCVSMIFDKVDVDDLIFIMLDDTRESRFELTEEDRYDTEPPNDGDEHVGLLGKSLRIRLLTQRDSSEPFELSFRYRGILDSSKCSVASSTAAASVGNGVKNGEENDDGDYFNTSIRVEQEL